MSFRRTVKLRIELSKGCAELDEVQVFADVEWADSDLCVYWDDAEAGEGRLEGHNCEITSAAPRGEGGKAEVLAPQQWRAPSGERRYGLRVGVRHVVGKGDDHPDRSILTVRRPGRGFSLLVEPVAEGEVIHAPALGVRVWPASLGSTPPEPTAPGQTIYDRVLDMPEQSYHRAMEAMPPRESCYFVLGCEGGRQKFWIERNGDIFCPPNFIPKVPGKDTPKLKGEGVASFRFGLEKLLQTGRFVEDGYLPIMHTTWMQGALRVEQTAYAAPACRSILSGPMEGDDPVAAFVRFRFANVGDTPITGTLPIRAARVGSMMHTSLDPVPSGTAEMLALDDDRALALGDRPGEKWLRLIVSHSLGSVAEREGVLVYDVQLGPRASSEIVLKIPFVVLDEPGQAEALQAKDFAREHEEVRQFWMQRIQEGCEIVTPELDLNDFYRASLTHMMITFDREVGSDLVMPRVGGFDDDYANWPNESCMCIANLDARGYSHFAERCLEPMVHYQGTAGLEGDFSTLEGQFFGSGGYERGRWTVQHHGWVLWGLAQHFLFTRDAQWLQRVSPSMVRGCEWIIGERQSTMRTDSEGKRMLEWGMLPPGGLEDVKEWCFWLSNNVFTWWGFHWAAKALSEADHPEAGRLAAEAEAYRQDILASFGEASLRSPLVRLRDGTYVPHLPSRLYLRGRDFGWMRETLDGSLNLIWTELIDPNSDDATRILKDYEDNRYLSARYGYSLQDEERWWFDRGGFSMQPLLLQGPIAHLVRDEVAHYLRAYFNSFAVTFRQDTRACVEHPLPTMADWKGDHFKTSDEAQSADWLRLMFVQERGEELCLGRALPREWLADGSRIAIRRAMTHFGLMSMEIESATAQGRITVQLDPPRRNPPSGIRLRLRHPEAAPIQSVEIDRVGAVEYRIEDDWIVLPPLPSRVTIVAFY